MRQVVWMAVIAAVTLLAVSGIVCLAEDARGGSPLNELPSYIEQVPHFG